MRLACVCMLMCVCKLAWELFGTMSLETQLTSCKADDTPYEVPFPWGISEFCCMSDCCADPETPLMLLCHPITRQLVCDFCWSKHDLGSLEAAVQSGELIPVEPEGKKLGKRS